VRRAVLNNAIVRPLLISAALVGAQCVLNPVSAGAQGPGAAVTTTARSADAQTTEITEAATAFLANLSDQQKRSVIFDFKNSEQRARWSNLPVTFVKREGIAWGAMDASQRDALIRLLRAVLGQEGVKNVEEQMAADDTLKVPAGRDAGRAPAFGSDHYYVSFVGIPSMTTPWMLQFGGHHLGINATVVGPNLTVSPSLTGGQPLKFIADGKPIYIVL
jgi:hypothetical protein